LNKVETRLRGSDKQVKEKFKDLSIKMKKNIHFNLYFRSHLELPQVRFVVCYGIMGLNELLHFNIFSLERGGNPSYTSCGRSKV